MVSVATETDETLMQRVRAGDTGALDTLFRRHHAAAHAVCVRISGSASSADDLVQESFLRVIRKAGTFRGEATFRTWLLTIVRNVCLDHERSESRRNRLHNAAAAATDTVVSQHSGGDTVGLQQALAALPHDLREALVLSRVNDLTHREVAAVLGCTEGAARVRVHRALTRLRELLAVEAQRQ